MKNTIYFFVYIASCCSSLTTTASSICQKSLSSNKQASKKIEKVIVLGPVPKEQYQLPIKGRKNAALNLFRQAFNRGQFVGDERFISFFSEFDYTFQKISFGEPPVENFIGKVIGIEENTVKVKFYDYLGRKQNKKLSQEELSHAAIEFTAKISFQNLEQMIENDQFFPNRIGPFIISTKDEETPLRNAGFEEEFINGFNEVNKMLAWGEIIQNSKIHPYKTQIDDFLDQIHVLINFIREGILSQDVEIQKRLQILEEFRQDALKKAKEQKLTYAYLLHWHNNLSALATNPVSRVHIIQSISEHIRKKDLSHLGNPIDILQRTEEEMQGYFLRVYGEQSVFHKVNKYKVYEYIAEALGIEHPGYTYPFHRVDYDIYIAIANFPSTIIIPTIHADIGIFSLNRMSVNNITPAGVPNKDIEADGKPRAPSQFFRHEFDHRAAGFGQGGLLQILKLSPTDLKKLHSSLIERMQALEKTERKIKEFLYFLLAHNEGFKETLTEFEQFNYDNTSKKESDNAIFWIQLEDLISSLVHDRHLYSFYRTSIVPTNSPKNVDYTYVRKHIIEFKLMIMDILGIKPNEENFDSIQQLNMFLKRHTSAEK